MSKSNTIEIEQGMGQLWQRSVVLVTSGTGFIIGEYSNLMI